MKKENIDFTVGIFLIIIGSMLMLIPRLTDISIKTALTTVFSIYTIINFFKYALTFKSKDYEGIQVALASLITGFLAFYFDINQSPKYLALTLFIWIILLALIKLKKADYYHDRSNKLWIFKIFSLIFFILTGILTSINLYYNNDVQTLILGYFFLTNGLLETIEPLTVKINDWVQK